MQQSEWAMQVNTPAWDPASLVYQNVGADRSRALQEAQWCVAVTVDLLCSVIKNVKDKEIWTEQLKREKVSGVLFLLLASKLMDN